MYAITGNIHKINGLFYNKIWRNSNLNVLNLYISNIIHSFTSLKLLCVSQKFLPQTALEAHATYMFYSFKCSISNEKRL